MRFDCSGGRRPERQALGADRVSDYCLSPRTPPRRTVPQSPTPFLPAPPEPAPIPDWLQALPALGREAIELASVFNDDVALSALAECLNATDPDRRARRIEPRHLRDALTHLPDGVELVRGGILQWNGSPHRLDALRALHGSRAAAWLRQAPAVARALLRVGGYRWTEASVALLRVAMVAGADEVTLERSFGPQLSIDPGELQHSATDLLVGGADPGWLDPALRGIALLTVLNSLACYPQPATGHWLQLAAGCVDAVPPLRSLLADHALLRDAPLGDEDGASAVAQASRIAFTSDDPARVVAAIDAELERLPRERGKRRPLPVGIPGLLYALALAARDRDAPRLKQMLRQAEKYPGEMTSAALTVLADWRAAEHEGRRWNGAPLHRHDALSLWTQALLLQWADLPAEGPAAASLQKVAEAMQSAGWTRMHGDIAHRLSGTEPAIGPARWRRPTPAWQQLLSSLEQLAESDTSTSAPAGSRLKVVLGRPDSEGVRIELFEQRTAAKGGWTAGRALYGDASAVFERLPDDAEHDRRLLSAWQSAARSSYGRHFPPDSPLLAALEGHPNVWLDAGPTPMQLQVARRLPTLQVERLPDGRLRLALDPPAPAHHRRLLRFDAGRLTLIDFDEQVRRLHNLLRTQAELPADALPALLKVAPQLAGRVELSTDLGATSTVTELDTRIHVLIEPLGDGLKFSLRVRPLGTAGVYLVPGQGSRELLGMRDGLPVRGERVFDREHAALQQVLDACPLLAGGEHGEPIELGEPDSALELLQMLTELGDAVELAWPASRPRRVSRTSGLQQLTLRLSTQREWFTADGGLALDDGSVVQLSTLLEHLPSSQSRFVRLADDRVVALSQDLARQLRLLRALGESDRKGLKLAPQATVLLEPLLDQVAEAELDRGFRQQLRRIATAADRDAPLPADFAADLRDYQRDGYRWLMRLAGWGAGALLADDMGLGKTVQALAMLAARAGEGPALVVAPTSVIGNWRGEAIRFAPALEVQVYGDGDREAQLESLAAGSLLLVSYGLLAANADAFAERRFATLVLDEAQAIKNPSTQRAQAARRVQADFRLAMTGTPIENHLGELWSLMRVLNPGLLGSRERFQQRFVSPIEREPRAPERDLLRRLIGPFLLRRLKSQVLDELPPRTEIVLRIEPGPGEARLLAALRRQALDRLAADATPSETKRFHVLAELTRLRRAACHPQLVAPELELTSSKLNQLVELVQELRDNRHRALVFSQFTDYLALVRERFDADGIGYQYLDGSTPAAARDAAVRAFQRGDGDVFLLSLKAGGVGLNLTAADYVIHLDPWWNPAVEQQATDRAHRIGQTRPVTVYKLVVAGSIEEQILAMHGDKRELVDAVLEDRAQPGRLDVDELVALLAENA